MLRELKHPNVIEFFDIGEIATGEVGHFLLLISSVHGAGRLHSILMCSFASLGQALKDSSSGSWEDWVSEQSSHVHVESAQVYDYEVTQKRGSVVSFAAIMMDLGLIWHSLNEEVMHCQKQLLAPVR